MTQGIKSVTNIKTLRKKEDIGKYARWDSEDLHDIDE
jgi:hypothetical protein